MEVLSSNCKIKRLCYDRLEKAFDQPIKCDIKTYENIQKITTG